MSTVVNSDQLRDAINDGARIIITTLQKFPVIGLIKHALRQQRVFPAQIPAPEADASDDPDDCLILLYHTSVSCRFGLS